MKEEEEEEEGIREVCRGYDCEVLFPGRAAVAARELEGEFCNVIPLLVSGPEVC